MDVLPTVSNRTMVFPWSFAKSKLHILFLLEIVKWMKWRLKENMPARCKASMSLWAEFNDW